jgi:CHAD domain-containing protein
MAEGKWISELTADTPVADAARRVLSLRLEVVRDHLALALREPDEDPEHVHQLRVGTRRATAALDIFSLCLPSKVCKSSRKQLRQIRRAAGAARDWDVFLMALAAEKEKKADRRRAGLDFLTGYALSQRTLAQTQLEQANPHFPFAFERFLAETVAAVHKPHSGTPDLLDLACSLLGDLLNQLNGAVGQDLHDYEHLHQVRILGKRLRYAMEVFAACFAEPFRDRYYLAVEEMQDILGRANDSHVASQRLAALRDKVHKVLPGDWKRFRPGIEGLLHFHEQRLPQERQQFLDWWQRWNQSGAAAGFAALLRTPQPSSE